MCLTAVDALGIFKPARKTFLPHWILLRKWQLRKTIYETYQSSIILSREMFAINKVKPSKQKNYQTM